MEIHLLCVICVRMDADIRLVILLSHIINSSVSPGKDRMRLSQGLSIKGDMRGKHRYTAPMPICTKYGI